VRRSTRPALPARYKKYKSGHLPQIKPVTCFELAIVTSRRQSVDNVILRQSLEAETCQHTWVSILDEAGVTACLAHAMPTRLSSTSQCMHTILQLSCLIRAVFDILLMTAGSQASAACCVIGASGYRSRTGRLSGGVAMRPASSVLEMPQQPGRQSRGPAGLRV
jgi:hypothetical protein